MGRFRTTLVVLVLSAGFYLLLIDTTDSPELYAAAGVVLLAIAAFELSRREGFAELRITPGHLRCGWRVLVRAPVEVVLVSRLALQQLLAPRATRGVFRAIPFDGGARADDAGRRALAEALGSLTPNTIVVGIDPERDLLLAHQLQRQGGAEQLDPLELG